uniref:Glycosyl hydrolase n=1 Tax=Eiseniibacteriota bacterium TaxID=2212470 RepID=A0A832I2W2_UNCEI
MRWRLVGPFRGGRVTAVTGVPGSPRLYYMGATGGGVWRTTDAGASWQAISDSTFGTGSVGAIAVAPSDPNVMYVGMGELPIRGNVSHGDGVYRSTDAGRTWSHLGLAGTSQIARVRVHPNDPDLVYVAALGRVFGPNAERGVFRSKDGGRTWERVLHVDERTGASDLVMDPTNPRILYAGFWQVHRRPWTLESGGPGSSLWKSVDGGDTWTRLTQRAGNGLPQGVLGKICVAVSPARPQRVWAMVEAEDGGLFRSDDAGESWTRVNEDRSLRQRAWYFSRLVADPKDAEKVWVLNVRLHLSRDGGRTFQTVATPHPDHHDHWIDPADPERMISGNDGGACVSEDGGRTWSSLDNQPTAQFYRVAVDRQFPYRIYGAQQDNSTVSIPHRTTGWGIERTDWWDVGGGESGWIAPKWDEPDVVYAGSYGGYLTRFDRRTQQRRDINVYPDNPMGHGAEGMRYRFQWNFPVLVSRHDASVLYAAGNMLFRSLNEGQSWEAISPDLTRNDPTKLGPSGGPITKDNTSVEYYCTIFALAESPLRKGVLWAGTDDGRIHVTEDGGGAWRDVTPRGLPEWSQVNALEASPHDPGTAYAAVVRYKLDDFRPYVYATRDYGRTWTRLVNGLPPDAFVRVVREDPARKGLLYAGTETGVFVSFDGGARWQGLQLNLPVTPVTDLVVAGDDLVAATQGRAFWCLDDLGPLRQLAADPRADAVRLYTPDTAVRLGGAGVPRNDAGRNPPAGALVRWWLRDAPPDSATVRLEFLDAAGAVVRAFDRRGEVPRDTAERRVERGPRVPAAAGGNQFVWDLRGEGATRFEGLVFWGGVLDGPIAVPGRYRVRLTVGSAVREAAFDVVKDPRLATTDEDFRLQHDLHRKIRDKLSETNDAVAAIRDAREQMDVVVARARRAGRDAVVADSARALKARLTAIEETLHQTRTRSPQDPLNYPIRLNNKLSLLGETVESADARPTDQALAVWADLSAKVDAELAKLRRVLTEDVAAFNRLVREREVPAVAPKPVRAP